jgi:hypothetical protein
MRSYGNHSSSTQLKPAQQFHVKDVEQLVWVDIQARQNTILFPQFEASQQQCPVRIHAAFSEI